MISLQGGSIFIKAKGLIYPQLLLPIHTRRGISTAYVVNRLAPSLEFFLFPLQFRWEVRASSCVNKRPLVGAIIGGSSVERELG